MLISRYRFPVVGLYGLKDKPSPHGFCHGAVPSLSCAMSLSARRCAKSLVFISPPFFCRVKDPLHFAAHLRPRARPHEKRSFPLHPDQTIPRTLAFPHPAAFDQLPHLGLILFALFPYG